MNEDEELSEGSHGELSNGQVSERLEAIPDALPWLLQYNDNYVKAQGKKDVEISDKWKNYVRNNYQLLPWPPF